MVQADCLRTQPIINNQDKWGPLESILECWLTMIRKGKVVTMSEDHKALPQSLAVQDHWVEMPYSEIILIETIDTFS